MILESSDTFTENQEKNTDEEHINSKSYFHILVAENAFLKCSVLGLKFIFRTPQTSNKMGNSKGALTFLCACS